MPDSRIISGPINQDENHQTSFPHRAENELRMNSFRLSELLEAVQGTPIRLSKVERQFRGVCTDSRQVQAGDLFWAIRGEKFDGHDYVEEALNRGAIACVVNRDCGKQTSELIKVDETLRALMAFGAWQRQKSEALIIGVTGSVGKTTTREMIYRVLSQRFNGIRNRRNYNNEIGVPLTLLELGEDHEFAVIEMGARHIGDIATLCDLVRPEIGVITGIAEAHLETFGSLDQIRSGKGELFEALPASGFGILAGAPRSVMGMAERANCPVLRVGSDEAADLQATGISFIGGRLSFQLEGTTYELSVPGKHFLSAALCAVAVAREIGMTAEEIAAGLAEFHPVEGRANVERIGSWSVINDAYNASPSSMTAACEVLEDFTPARKRILVVGDMLELGTEAARLHRELGHTIAAHRIDHLIAFGPHAGEVTAGGVNAGMHAYQVAQAESLETVQLLLDCWLEPNDAILIKGSRGMQMERVISWLRDQAARQEQPEPPGTGERTELRAVA